MITQIKGKLAYDTKEIILQAHHEAKSFVKLEGISYAEAFRKSLKLSWDLAKYQMNRKQIVAGQICTQMNAIGGVWG